MKISKLDVDEALARKGVFGTSDEELLKKIEKTQSQDEKFCEMYSLVFGKKQQPGRDGGDPVFKIMSALPDGRIVFVDRSQDEEEIILEDPYICLVFKQDRVAFAKILFPEYQPHIYIPPNRLPAMVWRDDKGRVQRRMPVGNSYEERIVKAVKDMEKMGFEHVKVVFRKNIR